MKTNIQIIIIAMMCFCLLSACNNTEKTGYLKEGALVCADYDTFEEYLNVLQHMGNQNHYQILAIHDHYSARGCFLTEKKRPIIVLDDKNWATFGTTHTSGVVIAKILPYRGESIHAFTLENFIVYN